MQFRLRTADPIRVIVSCVVGSSMAGALSMLFHITLPAPHGGLFVIMLVNKPLLYILSIAIGSMISALMMGIWKKKNTIKNVKNGYLVGSRSFL